MATEEGGIITYSDTTTTDAIFYQPSPFIGFSHVKKMTPIDAELWSENSCLFFISALKHRISGDFDYAHKLNKMGEIEVPLPTKENHIDFDYMNAYIQEMKRTHIKMIEGYFKTTLKKYNDIVFPLNLAIHHEATKDTRIENNVREDAKYMSFLPVYSLRAACGYFEDNIVIPENEAEGWIDISESGIKANRNMFVIYATGDSMLPKIKNGDLCVFELYSTENGGTREGEIVLTECPDKDTDTDCHYTIKKYHSTWHFDNEGKKIHDSVELIPLNRDEYESVVYRKGKKLRTIGIFKGVL